MKILYIWKYEDIGKKREIKETTKAQLELPPWTKVFKIKLISLSSSWLVDCIVFLLLCEPYSKC